MKGAAQIPRTVTTPRIKARETMSAPLSLRAALFPPEVRICVKTGIKAADSAPSANNTRRMLGIPKATKNASALWPAPKALATIMSRRKPKTRLVSVAPLTTPADRAIRAPRSPGPVRARPFAAGSVELCIQFPYG